MSTSALDIDSEKTLTQQSTANGSSSTRSSSTSHSRIKDSSSEPEKPHQRPHNYEHDHDHNHNHGPEFHNDHYHAHPHTHRHTVIHAIRSAHPPHHHHEHRTRKHLIARPRARQYFTVRDGDLHRQCDDGIPRQAGKFELFLDLLYIGLVATFAEDVVQNPTDVGHFWKYVLIFIPAWRIWSDLTTLTNQYYNDDLLQRLLILWTMLVTLLYSNNAISVATSLSSLRLTVSAFLISRFSIITIRLIYSFTVAHHSFQLRVHSLLCLATLPLWTPLYLESVSTGAKIAVAVIAFGADMSVTLLTHNRYFVSKFELEHSVALDIDHHIERMTAFFIIVLGEFLYNLVRSSPGAVDSRFGSAAMSLVIAFCLCWLYVSCDGSRDNPETGVHAIRWKGVNAMVWFGVHLPLSMGLLLAGHCCGVFVSGEVVSDAEVAKRADGGDDDEEARMMNGLRWIFCGGMAVGIACLWAICMLHHESDEDEHTRCQLLLPKKIRRFTRLPIAIIIACLPLSKLPAIYLLSVTMCLLVFAVLWEMVGSLDAREWTIMESGKMYCQDEEIVMEGKPSGQEEEGRVVLHTQQRESGGEEVKEVIEQCSLGGCQFASACEVERCGLQRGRCNLELRCDAQECELERMKTCSIAGCTEGGLERTRTCSVSGCTEARLERTRICSVSGCMEAGRRESVVSRR